MAFDWFIYLVLWHIAAFEVGLELPGCDHEIADAKVQSTPSKPRSFLKESTLCIPETLVKHLVVVRSKSSWRYCLMRGQIEQTNQ